MATFYQVLGCSSFSHWNLWRLFYFLIRSLVRRSRWLSAAMSHLSNDKTSSGSSALLLTFTSLSGHGEFLVFVQLTLWLRERQWGYIKYSWLWHTFKPFIFCAHSMPGAGRRYDMCSIQEQVPLHWETPDNLEVLLFPLAPPSDSSYLFLLLTSVQRIFTSARVGKTQSCTSMYFFFKFIDDRNTWVPQTCGNCSF